MATFRTERVTTSRRRRAVIQALLLAACAQACDTATPLQPTNHSPVVQSLTVFPSTLGVGDSAVVVCTATDAEGDALLFDWTSDCRMLKKGNSLGDFTMYSRGPALVVYAGPCNRAPLDTGWVLCEVRDDRGGGTYAGRVSIVVRQ